MLPTLFLSQIRWRIKINVDILITLDRWTHSNILGHYWKLLTSSKRLSPASGLCENTVNFQCWAWDKLRGLRTAACHYYSCVLAPRKKVEGGDHDLRPKPSLSPDVICKNHPVSWFQSNGYPRTLVKDQMAHKTAETCDVGRGRLPRWSVGRASSGSTESLVVVWTVETSLSPTEIGRRLREWKGTRLVGRALKHPWPRVLLPIYIDLQELHIYINLL